MNKEIEISCRTYEKAITILADEFAVEKDGLGSDASKRFLKMVERIKKLIDDSGGDGNGILDDIDDVAKEYFKIGIKRGLRRATLMTMRKDWKVRDDKITLYKDNINVQTSLTLPSKAIEKQNHNFAPSDIGF